MISFKSYNERSDKFRMLAKLGSNTTVSTILPCPGAIRDNGSGWKPCTIQLKSCTCPNHDRWFFLSDINKFLWMVRIGGSTDRGAHIKESDYYTSNGEFRVDREGSPTLLNCLMYKLCYYRFGSMYTEQGTYPRSSARTPSLVSWPLTFVCYVILASSTYRNDILFEVLNYIFISSIILPPGYTKMCYLFRSFWLVVPNRMIYWP